MTTNDNTRTKPKRKTRARPVDEPPPELSTEYALGSDGHLYVTEESFKPGATAGRKQFVGYQLTDEEAAEVWDHIHQQAFNATQALRARR